MQATENWRPFIMLAYISLFTICLYKFETFMLWKKGQTVSLKHKWTCQKVHSFHAMVVIHIKHATGRYRCMYMQIEPWNIIIFTVLTTGLIFKIRIPCTCFDVFDGKMIRIHKLHHMFYLKSENVFYLNRCSVAKNYFEFYVKHSKIYMCCNAACTIKSTISETFFLNLLPNSVALKFGNKASF